MKKLHHKIIIVLLVFAVLAVGFFSYIGLNGLGYHVLTQSTESGTVNFWYTNDQLTNYYNNVASVCNKTHRGADVVPKLVSAGEYLEQIYKASREGQEYPDIYVITSDAMEKAYLSGLTMPVENESGVKKNFPDVAVEAASYEGMLLGYPFYFDTRTLVYNKTLLEKIAYDQFELQASENGESVEELEVTEEQIQNLVNIMIPETIDELIEFANNLEAPEGLETVFKWNINDVFFNYFYLGEYTTLSSNEIDIYNEETEACIEIFKHLTEYFYMDAETVSSESILEEFKQGTMLFTILDSEAAVELEKAKADGELTFDFDYALIPNPSEELQGRPLSVTNVVVVNGYTNFPETAVGFAEFMTMENYCADQLYDKSGYLPAFEKAAADTNMEVVFKQEYAESANMPNYMVTSNFWMLLENAFNEIWDGADTAQTLEALEERLKNQIPE